MLLCDTNIWLALALSGHVHHRASRAWLDTINAPGVIHFCRATQQSLLRLLTNRTVLGAYGSPPLTNREAWAAYAAFLDDDRIVLAGAEPDGLEAQWRAFAVRQSPAPKVWMDAYLAAFALTGGFELVTTDTAFTQYGGIELRLLAKCQRKPRSAHSSSRAASTSSDTSTLVHTFCTSSLSSSASTSLNTFRAPSRSTGTLTEG
ncbi:putative TOXIN VAPC41, CONTAINS PIN DOMAIN [Mycobacterium tuberculosis]|nr:putative TOXIN VAPC41, CONTAINS PIN DOMAIN [Mycobacterium tuberculosis]SGB24180.1 putative TOXIN VAPC41, CONTAINS PIN DOMAIN [Mycobacterium tuberculosis]SGB25722.1 putative TOXIN VAPC41, CONTAINS PIN DOMAIN [Mycobacterium tuberculosis]SGG72758.1 putative TOXIN VAPC41, CONTAINS PIN DOMAIN [Mycobacterium tuberculosis]SGO13674.1 putative TOXIN VAPC41, CONTAINS PIN DOMAIN [Mycobacterium tuberculosis]